MSDTPERPHERPTFEPAPPTEVGPPPAPPTQMAPPAGAPGTPPSTRPGTPPGPGAPPPGPAGGSPYGQPSFPPYQQPAPAPFGGAPYGGAPSPYQPKNKGGKTALVVVLIVGLVILLFCGGIIGLFVWIFNSVESSIPDGDREGGPNNPITVEEGEAFEIDDFEFAEGWTVTRDEEYEYSDYVTIEGLETENRGESADNMYLTFTFVTGSEELGEITCSTDGDVQAGRSEKLDCSSSMETSDIEGYDEIEVATSY